jgi:hypothetical protein
MTLLSAQNLNSLLDEFPGVTAVTMTRAFVSALSAGTSGTLYARLIVLPPGLTVNNLDYLQVGAATTPSHGWMCLMTPGGLVVTATTDNTGGQAANTYYRSPVTTPFTTPPGAPSLWYIGVMLAATTMGTMAGLSGANTVTGPAGTLPSFVTGGTGLTTPVAAGAQQTLTGVGSATAAIYAATA